MAIPSQSFSSEEGCHWFNVGFPPDVFILDVVVFCLASSQMRVTMDNAVSIGNAGYTFTCESTSAIVTISTKTVKYRYRVGGWCELYPSIFWIFGIF